MVCICARKKYQFGGRAQFAGSHVHITWCKLTAAWCTVFFDLSEQEIDGECNVMQDRDNRSRMWTGNCQRSTKAKKTDSGFRENKCGGSNRTSGLRYKLH